MSSSSPNRLGLTYGLVAMFIWGSVPAVTTLGLEANLTTTQIAILRYGAALPFLIYPALRGPNSIVDWMKAFVLTFGAGLPYFLVSSEGLKYASAIHAGIIIPASMMLFSLFAGHFFLQDKLTRPKQYGVLLIFLGLGSLFVSTNSNTEANFVGHLIFICAGLQWAGYTILIRVWALDGGLVAARATVLSILMCGLLFAFNPDQGFGDIPYADLTLQASWQGFFTVVVALVAFGKAVSLLGVNRSAVLTSLLPVFSTLAAFIILGDRPTAVEVAGLMAIVGGLIVAVKTKRNTVKLQAEY